jgi:REP-associated tyrosine transposase
MPRRGRASVGDIAITVINRGNAQIKVFHKDGEFRAFVELIGLACQRISVRVLT